ncbi:MAG: hypothetical protein ACLGG8_10965 [Gammaproteobacteria bacterium]
MNRLESEWKRLFVPASAASCANRHDDLVDPGGDVRAIVIELGRPADWRLLAPLWLSVQTDLGWPAPAIAVNGLDAFALWIPLSGSMTAGDARAVLEVLQQRYLADVKADRVRLWPKVGTQGVHHAAAVPREVVKGQRWSAFVAPDLAAVFGDEPALDLPPGADAQADLLAQMTPVPVQAARQLLTGQASPPLSGGPGQIREDAKVAEPARQGGGGADPRTFLVSVMNDPSVAMALRIEAAKALLGVSGPAP